MHSGSLPIAADTPPDSRSLPSGRELLVEIYHRYFETVPADTPERLDEAYRLRYQVYCVEHPFENPLEHPDERERDIYDAHSVHSLLIHRPTGSVAGTVRLILPNDDIPLPIASICHHALLKERLALAPRNTAELSRFAVSKQFRRRATDTPIVDYGIVERAANPDPMDRRVMPHITLGLMKAVFDMSLERGITHLFAVMEPALLRLINRIGIVFDPIGPLVDYHGGRQPCHSGLSELLGRLRPIQPEIWTLITGARDF